MTTPPINDIVQCADTFVHSTHTFTVTKPIGILAGSGLDSSNATYDYELVTCPGISDMREPSPEWVARETLETLRQIRDGQAQLIEYIQSAVSRFPGLSLLGIGRKRG